MQLRRPIRRCSGLRLQTFGLLVDQARVDASTSAAPAAAGHGSCRVECPDVKGPGLGDVGDHAARCPRLQHVGIVSLGQRERSRSRRGAFEVSKRLQADRDLLAQAERRIEGGDIYGAREILVTLDETATADPWETICPVAGLRTATA